MELLAVTVIASLRSNPRVAKREIALLSLLRQQ